MPPRLEYKHATSKANTASLSTSYVHAIRDKDGSLSARAPEQHSGTPSRGILTHARLCEPAVGRRSLRSHACRRFGRLWLRHGTLPGLPYAFRASGAAVSFVLESLSNTPARLQDASSRTTDLSRAKSCVSQQWEDAHSDRTLYRRRGFVRLWLRHGTLLGLPYAFRGSLRARAPEQHSGTPS